MENRINHIIARVLSGESSSDDILSLSEWLNENEKNRDEFRRLKNYWDADVAFKHSVAPAFSADKLQQKINVQRRQTARRQLWRSAIPLIAAACLLFIFSTAFFHYNTNDRTSEYYTLLTGEHTSDFTMEDGTVIILNKNSRLSYSDKYVKAEAESDDITATLVEGSIRFEGAKQNIVMTPNQQLTFSRSTNKVDLKETDTDTFTAWKDGLLKYKSIPFIQLVENLKNIYQVEISIDDDRLANPSVTVSGTFASEQSLEQILKVISNSLPVRWTNHDGIYHIQYITLKR